MEYVFYMILLRSHLIPQRGVLTSSAHLGFNPRRTSWDEARQGERRRGEERREERKGEKRRGKERREEEKWPEEEECADVRKGRKEGGFA